MPNHFSDAALKAIAQAQQAQEQPAPYAERAKAAETGMGPLGKAALWGGQGLDLGTTAVMAASDRFREANALGAAPVIGLKAALMVALPWLAKELNLSRKQSDILGVAVGATGAIPGVKNLHTYATTPKR